MYDRNNDVIWRYNLSSHRMSSDLFNSIALHANFDYAGTLRQVMSIFIGIKSAKLCDVIIEIIISLIIY